MKRFGALILGLWLIFLPFVPHFMVGVFRAEYGMFQTAIFSLLLLVLLLISFQMKNLKPSNIRSNISIVDILVLIGFIYWVLRIVTQGVTHVDELILLTLITVSIGYVLVRFMGQCSIILHAISISAFFQSLVVLAQKMGYISSGHQMFDVTGAFGNPGQVAGYIAIGLNITFSFCYYAFRQQKRNRILLYVAMSLCMMAALWITDSRASLVAVIVGLFTVGSQYIRKGVRGKIKIILPITAMGISIFMIFMFAYRPASANARMLIWRITSSMIWEKPIFGHGIGAFSKDYMLYQANYFQNHPQSSFSAVADNVAYPYNEILHVTVESGFLGMVIVVMIVFFSLSCQPENYFEKVVKGGLATWIIFAMFSYPSTVFSLLFFVPIFIGLSKSENILSFKPNKAVLVGAQIVSILLITIFFYMMQFYERSSLKSVRLFESETHFSPESMRRLLKSSLFGNYYATYIGINHKAFEDSLIGYLPPTCETYTDYGDIYAERGDFSKAEHYYKIANYMIPTRLSPNHGLWKLYLAKGDTTHAIKIANHIISQPLKIENTYTLKTKGEMKRFLKQYSKNH